MVTMAPHIIRAYPKKFLIWDMSDCYTWSFPEFLPFCLHLYYFSSFKAYKTIARA
jgi:hypothetical protein